MATLKSGECDPALVSRYVSLFERARNVRDVYAPAMVMNDRVNALTGHLDPRITATVFSSEPVNGSIHEFILRNIWRANEAQESLVPTITFLQEARGLEKPSELMGHADPIGQAMVEAHDKYNVNGKVTRCDHYRVWHDTYSRLIREKNGVFDD